MSVKDVWVGIWWYLCGEGAGWRCMMVLGEVDRVVTTCGGYWGCSVSIIVMICFLIDPTNFLWVAFYAVLPKCNHSYRAGHNSTPWYHWAVFGSADKSARDSSCS
ncbi:hypothetical protein F5877DRAFT_73041 [Lentinula edodes]|nr:hypothetical protein F5877DRAFT_73041 [Lentinula edodes]